MDKDAVMRNNNPALDWAECHSIDELLFICKKNEVFSRGSKISLKNFWEIFGASYQSKTSDITFI